MRRELTFAHVRSDEQAIISIFFKQGHRTRVFVGQTIVPLLLLMGGKQMDRKLALYGRPGEADELLVRGRLHVQMHYTDEPNSMLSENGFPVVEIPTRLRTGDLVLVSTKRALSLTTKVLTGSKWDHVCMVVQVNDMLMLFEAVHPAGVRLIELAARIRAELAAESTIGIRKLRYSVEEKGWQFTTLLRKVMGSLLGRPYEGNLFELFKALLPSSGSLSSTTSPSLSGHHHHQQQQQHQSSPLSQSAPPTIGVSNQVAPFVDQTRPVEMPTALFCSELVAYTFQSLGLLPTDPPAGRYTPATFGSQNLRFLDGVLVDQVTKFSRRSLRPSKRSRVTLKRPRISIIDNQYSALTIRSSPPSEFESFTDPASLEDNDDVAVKAGKSGFVAALPTQTEEDFANALMQMRLLSFTAANRSHSGEQRVSSRPARTQSSSSAVDSGRQVHLELLNHQLHSAGARGFLEYLGRDSPARQDSPLQDDPRNAMLESLRAAGARGFLSLYDDDNAPG